MATPLNQSSSLPTQEKFPISTKAITEKAIKTVGVVVKTAIKVAVLVVGLLIMARAFLPLLCIEAAVRLYMKCKTYFIDDKDLMKPKLIIFAAAEDSMHSNPILVLNSSRRKLMEEYHIEVHTVSTIKDINKHLNETQDIAAIWFAVHSNDEVIVLNPKKHKEAGLITKNNIHQLDFSGVAKEVPIIIEGCEAGKRSDGVVSIAQRVAQVAVGHKVYAATKGITQFCTFISSAPKSPLKVQWRRFNLTKDDSSRLDHIASSVWSVVLAMVPSAIRNHRFVTSDITQCHYVEDNVRDQV